MKSTTQIHTLAYQADPEVYFLAINQLAYCTWLDSGKPYSEYGRYDILTAAPQTVLQNPNAEQIEQAVTDITPAELSSELKSLKLPFTGGALGFFNYEYNNQTFNIDLSQKHSKSSIQQSTFCIYTWALIQDHLERKAYLVFLPACPSELKAQVLDLVKKPPALAEESFHVKQLAADLEKEEYKEAFAKIHEYILAGDCYQINFAQRFSGDFSGSSQAAYLALRKSMPSPFCAYMNLGDDAILSFSPERFIQIEHQHAVTQPIKGTAPRGKTPSEDKKLATALQNSEKNRAENLMIVDLLRNDFSKSCKPFSVKVPSLFSLESFANVHHLVSTVEGELEASVSPLRFFLHCFPGGSITGAPKKRAMEIIFELEDHPRNIYCGSMCYLSTTGRFDSSITIRTLLINDGKIYCWGGGGIVADSVAEEEYQESLQKVGVLLEGLHANLNNES